LRRLNTAEKADILYSFDFGKTDTEMSEKMDYSVNESFFNGNNDSASGFINQGNTAIPAINGGTPVRTKPWPAWPQWNQATDEELIIKVMRSGTWSRAEVVSEFEKKWAQLIGSKRCLGVVNGTNALITSLVQLGIGAGDEVIIPPYTFIASVQSIFQAGAMPVFVDVNPETFQIDPEKIEARITPRTAAIMPVHILGLPSDMNRIMAIARKHKLLVIEDACQAWLAEIGGKRSVLSEMQVVSAFRIPKIFQWEKVVPSSAMMMSSWTDAIPIIITVILLVVQWER
jgi:hypothetical protein